MPAEDSDALVEWVRTRFFGKYRGVVTDVEPPAFVAVTTTARVCSSSP